MRVTTNDIYEVSLLRCHQGKLIGMRQNCAVNKHRPEVVFTIEGDDSLEFIQEAYNDGDITVNLRSYCQSLEEIKRKMFDFIRSQNAS